MKVKVFAKLNLSLNVMGVNDGYHMLDSVATSINIFDVVSVTLRNDGQINVSCVDVLPQNNVAYRAAKQFFAVFGGEGCDIVIDKGIPFSQGLGGSSADASATVYCLAKLLGVDLCDSKVKQVCDSVGSDVYFMLRGGFGKITGRSEAQFLQPVTLYGCLTTFDYASDTASVFRQYDVAPVDFVTDNQLLVEALTKGQTSFANSLCFNALQGASSALSSYANPFVDCCQRLGVKATMTGSGSAYFVLCNTLQDASSLAAAFAKEGFCSVAFCSVPQGILPM